jgi:hypothetical protein
MSYSDYVKAMSYLDAIENELNKIAEAVNHPSFDEFFEAAEQKAA